MPFVSPLDHQNRWCATLKRIVLYFGDETGFPPHASGVFKFRPNFRDWKMEDC
jgi:hypothetical protein